MLKKYWIFFMPIVFLLFMRFVLHFNGLYGQDAYEYLRYSGRLHVYLSGGAAPGDYFWPLGFPFYGALLSFITQDVSFALQLISTIALIGTLWFADKLVELLVPNAKGKQLFLLLFLLLSPFLLRSSIIAMSDAGAYFFVTGFFYYAFQFKRTTERKYLLFLFVFAANAFMFRYVSLILLVIPTIYILPEVWKRKPMVHILFGVLLFFIFILPHLFIRSSAPTAFLHHEWLSDWSFRNYFQSSFATADGQSHGHFQNLIYSLTALFHPGNFIFGIPFLAFLFVRRPYQKMELVIFGAVLLYILFLAGMPIQNLRFFLLPLPLFIIGAFRGFVFIYERLKVSGKIVLFLLAFFPQCVLFFIGFIPMYERNQLENSMKEWIIKNTKQQVIYAFDMDVSLKSGDLNRTFYNLWEKEYDHFIPNSLVVFNVRAFEYQWKGKNPMTNWKHMNQKYHLTPLQNFSQGWTVYEIR